MMRAVAGFRIGDERQRWQLSVQRVPVLDRKDNVVVGANVKNGRARYASVRPPTSMNRVGAVTALSLILLLLLSLLWSVSMRSLDAIGAAVSIQRAQQRCMIEVRLETNDLALPQGPHVDSTAARQARATCRTTPSR